MKGFAYHWFKFTQFIDFIIIDFKMCMLHWLYVLTDAITNQIIFIKKNYS